MHLEIRNKKGESFVFTESLPNVVKAFQDSGIDVEALTHRGYMQDGYFYQSNTLSLRELKLEFAIIANSEEELESVKRKLNKVLNPKNGLVEIIQVVNEGVFKIYALPDNISSYEVKAQYLIEGTVVFTCFNPFWQDIDETKVNIAQWNGTFKFPLKLIRPGITMGVKEPSLIVNVINKGDVESGMTIEFIARGTVKNPSLFNVNTREYIKLNRTLATGERIVINTNYGKKKITSEIGGITTDILNYYDLTSTFLQLRVGDNLFRYDAEENLNNLEVSIYFTNKYLGV